VIEEVAGAVKDLIKAGRVRQFGMSEAAAGIIRLQRPAPRTRRSATIGSRRSAAGHLTSRPMTPQALDAGSSTGLAGCGWPVRALAGCLVWAPAVVAGSDSVRCVLLVVR
jgi:hypothetical protein